MAFVSVGDEFSSVSNGPTLVSSRLGTSFPTVVYSDLITGTASVIRSHKSVRGSSDTACVAEDMAGEQGVRGERFICEQV